MTREEEAMVEGNCKEAQGLSWRSRNRSWWTSAVDISSTLLSKMDQVPARGFTLPWQAGAEGDQSKSPQSPQEFTEDQPVEFPKPRNEIATPAFEDAPSEIAKPPLGSAKPSLDCELAAIVDSPKLQTADEDSNSSKGETAAEEPRLTTRGAESRRRTKRMPVELAPAGLNQDDDADADAPIRSKKLSAVGREILLGEGLGTTRVCVEEMRRLCRHRKQLSEATLHRVDNASVLSSRRSCRSSRSWSHVEETIRNNPPRALPAPPSDSTKTGESLLPRDSYRVLKPLRLREDAVVLGGSLRVTTREAMDVHKTPLTSLPSSPRFSKESRKEKLFRTLGISTTHAENEIVVAKNPPKQKGLQAVNNLIVSQHQKFAKSLEPRKLGITNGVRNQEEGSDNAVALVEHARKKRSSTPWLFKWMWGSSSKPAAPPKLPMASPQRREAPPQEPKLKRHKRTASWGCASHASTAVITPLRGSRIHQDDNDAMENILESRVDCDVDEVYQDFENPGSFRGQEGEVFEDCHGSFRSVSSPASTRKGEHFEDCHHGSFRSVSRPASFSEGEVFEDCHHGSFRSVFRPASFSEGEVFEDCHHGSFRSVSRPASFSEGEVFEDCHHESFRSPSGLASFRKGEVFEDCHHGSFRSSSGLASFRKGEVFEDCHHGSFRSSSGLTSFRKGEHFEDCHHGSFRSSSGLASFRKGEVFKDCHGSFRSFSGLASFRKGEVFEDCHGSFRFITNCASFRSFDSADETECGLPPPLQADQTLTIGDVAALCNSSLKFVFKCREIQHFNKFLRSQKKRLLRAKGNSDCFNVILSGNDIEVSSMVAAMAYAWFLDNTRPKVTAKAWHAVAMIDIPRHQMHKHKNAAWLFDACGIDPAALLFADEMELASLVGAGRIKISTIGQDVLVTRNEVGSVCTLLGERLVAEAQALLEPRYMKTLLLAGVLLDTENLDFASMRDTEITTTLLVGSGSLGRNGFFAQLREAEDDDQVSKHMSRSYGDIKQLSSRKISSAAQAKVQQEADQEQSDKDSLFTQSQDHTSTSEAGTSSSVDEDSPRLKQSSSFKYTKLSHQLQSPSSTVCKEDKKAVAHLRKAATTQFFNSSCGIRSPSFSRLRKKFVLYQV